MAKLWGHFLRLLWFIHTKLIRAGAAAAGMGLSEAFILETGSCEFGQKKMKEGASGPVPQGPGSSGLEIRLGASPAPAPQNWGIREWGCAQDGARSLGSEEAGLLRAGALAGPRFPHPYEPWGTGSPGPKQDEAWGLTRSEARAPGVGACLSVCGFAGRCHVHPQSGASRGAGAGSSGLSPPERSRGADGGESRGQRGDLNQDPAWAPA